MKRTVTIEVPDDRWAELRAKWPETTDDQMVSAALDELSRRLLVEDVEVAGTIKWIAPRSGDDRFDGELNVQDEMSVRDWLAGERFETADSAP